MMTREEFVKAMDGVFAYNIEIKLLVHDQAQRDVIYGLSKKVKQLTARSDKMFGTPCEEMRHRQKVDELEAKIEQQAKEIAELKAIIQACNKDNLTDVVMRAVVESKTIREALQLLYDCQNGCPLPKYEADWHRAMKLTEQALKEVS